MTENVRELNELELETVASGKNLLNGVPGGIKGVTGY